MAIYLKQIRSDMKKFWKPRDYNKYKVTNISMVANKKNKTVTFKGLVNGLTDTYMVHLRFEEVSLSKSEDDKHIILMKDAKSSNDLWSEVIDIVKHPLNISCTCTDFRHTWAFPLMYNDALVGRPLRYNRITSPEGKRPKVLQVGKEINKEGNNIQGGRNFRNMINKGRVRRQVMGYCKHIHSFLNALNKLNRLKG